VGGGGLRRRDDNKSFLSATSFCSSSSECVNRRALVSEMNELLEAPHVLCTCDE